MTKQFEPSQQVLEKYADVLINFALGGGKGVKKGEVVRITVGESAKPLFVELRKAVLKAGAQPISQYVCEDDHTFNPSRDFYELANEEQLTFFPEKYLKGLINQIDHSVSIISTWNKHALEGVDPKKIMTSSQAMKPAMDWMNDKENKGKFTWTLALYGTEEMAKEVGLSLEEYWQQIIDGCYLNDDEPIKRWQETTEQIEAYKDKLTKLGIDKLHIEGEDVDLWITLGKKRKWLGGSGRNIPSFEIFTSPDWRGTEGFIKFNQPLYRYGSLIEGIELEFKKGQVTKAIATKNENLLTEMINTPNADKIGEFSLTDSRFSKITKFMGETLYDENVGGEQGNTHIAVGRAYNDTYDGNPARVSKKQWEEMGFNDSVVHTDIVSTTRRKVTAYLPNGKEKVIYDDGKFVI